MDTITTKQWLLIAGGIISGLMTGAALLTTLFGQNLTAQIVAALGVLNIVLNSVGTALSGQGSQIKDVLAMPGIDKINVNGAASSTLAAIAIDPSINRISPTPQAQAQVEATAKGV